MFLGTTCYFFFSNQSQKRPKWESQSKDILSSLWKNSKTCRLGTDGGKRPPPPPTPVQETEMQRREWNLHMPTF